MIIEAVASNRVGDFGGWTDTWFAESGAVVNFAIDLFARVTLRTRKRPGNPHRLDSRKRDKETFRPPATVRSQIAPSETCPPSRWQTLHEIQRLAVIRVSRVV